MKKKQPTRWSRAGAFLKDPPLWLEALWITLAAGLFVVAVWYGLRWPK